MTTTDTIHEAWASSPLVRTAIAAAPDDSALAILGELHKMMTQLEERAPGVRFAELFAALDAKKTDAGVMGVARILQANGHTDEEVTEILGSGDWLYLRDPFRDREWAARFVAGETAIAIATDVGVSTRTVTRALVAAGAPIPDPKWLTVGRYVNIHGGAAALAHFGYHANSLSGIKGWARRAGAHDHALALGNP